MMNEITALLQMWRSNRNLNIELDKNVVVGNLLEECSEYFRAQNYYDKIDALCDISVFCINGIDTRHEKYLGDIDLNNDRGQFDNNSIYNILTKISNAEHKNISSSLVDIVEITIEMITLMGYDYKKCMLETIKEITSREQCPIQSKEWHITGPKGKWQKNRNQDKSTIRQADYNRCYIGGIK